MHTSILFCLIHGCYGCSTTNSPVTQRSCKPPSWRVSSALAAAASKELTILSCNVPT